MAVYTSINDPSAYFQTVLYTGNGSNGHAITFNGNSNLQPDWLWGKERSQASNHNAFDTNRGLDKRITPDQADGENTDSTTVTSFNTNGFTLGSSNNINENGVTTVAWCWKANGGTTASNSSGNITSTVQANTTAGFSIVTYSGNGNSGATVGHGLGVVPNFIIIKNRSETKDWAVYHSANTSAPQTDALFLNLTDATIDNTGYWNDTAPTSSIITVGDNTKVNSSGQQHVAYCFTEKQGYSKFGSYTGNGNADGTFVNLGFKPAWVMIKVTSRAGDWIIVDDARSTSNVIDDYLRPNENNAEVVGSGATKIDFLSNGFKCRSTGYVVNESSASYIYMAFAASPFVSSAGVPTTAF